MGPDVGSLSCRRQTFAGRRAASIGAKVFGEKLARADIPEWSDPPTHPAGIFCRGIPVCRECDRRFSLVADFRGRLPFRAKERSIIEAAPGPAMSSQSPRESANSAMPIASPRNFSAQPTRRRWSLTSLGRTLFRSTGFALCLATLLGFFGRLSWLLELFSHFPVQYFWLLTAAALIAVLRRKPREALLFAGFAAVNAALVLPAYWGPSRVPGDRPRLRAVTFNVFGYHQHHSRILEFLRETEADLIVLLEVTPDWEKSLMTLRDAYPHQQIEALWDPFGVAVLSRRPLQNVQVHHLGGVQRPSVRAQLEFKGVPLTVIATHPYPPRKARLARLRQAHLNDLSRLVRKQSGAVLVLGDLNCTPWSPLFRDLLRKAGLRDSRRGFGVQATWPTWLPPMQIPIDHCLVSSEIAVDGRRVGPDLGSDHLPVVVDLSLASP